MTETELLYISALMPEDFFRSVFGYKGNTPGLAVQKYHRVMTEGLSKNENAKVHCISCVPVSRSNFGGLITPKHRSFSPVASVDFDIPRLVNFPILKQISLTIGIKKSIMSHIKEAKNNGRKCHVVTDLLSLTASREAILSAHSKGIKVTGIVTDLPEHLLGVSQKYIDTFPAVFDMCDSYVFLTEEMNVKLNTKNKPYIVIEGQVSLDDNDTIRNNEPEDLKNTFLYAGSLERIYGIELLTKAFIYAKTNKLLPKNANLVVYGCGDYEDELKILSSDPESGIDFRGTAPNSEVVKEELASRILVNPRPSADEFTKYSFPSKNMEYMLSGRPLLCTRLRGMPEEYFKYVMLIEDESVEGMARALADAADRSDEELSEIGKAASEFVIQEKNCAVQAGKILDLI